MIAAECVPAAGIFICTYDGKYAEDVALPLSKTRVQLDGKYSEGAGRQMNIALSHLL